MSADSDFFQYIPHKVYVMALLLILEAKINFSLGFDITYYQTNKHQYVHALYCTIVLYIVPKRPQLSQLEDSKGRSCHRKVKW